MDMKTIKQLAQEHSVSDLMDFADKLEQSGQAVVKTQEDPGDQMSDYLQAAELRKLMDQGKSVGEAVREFSKRVRGVLE